MLQKQPHNRFSTDLLLNHSWFRDDAHNFRMSNLYASENIVTDECDTEKQEDYRDDEFNDEDLTLTEDFNKTLNLSDENDESEIEQRPKRRRIV